MRVIPGPTPIWIGGKGVERGKARAHLDRQVRVLGDQQKIAAQMFAHVVGQVPLVLDARQQVPFDRVEGVRVHVIDHCRDQLAVIGKQDQTRMPSEFSADLIAQLVPAPQPVQWIVLRRQSDAERGERRVTGKHNDRGHGIQDY